MMLLLDHHFSTLPLSKALSRFLMLFRYFQAELCSYFEDEELTPNEWALPWLQDLLARNLPHDCLCRLWDTYFATDEGFDLHIYVCLAILNSHSEDLLELESAEITAFLARLPVMNMDQIIMHAYNLREKVIALKLL